MRADGCVRRRLAWRKVKISKMPSGRSTAEKKPSAQLKAPSQLGAEGRKATISQCGICSFLPKQAIVSIVIFGYLFDFVAGCCLVAVAAASWQPNPWPSCIRIDIHLRVSFIACSVSLSRFHSEDTCVVFPTNFSHRWADVPERASLAPQNGPTKRGFDSI